MWEDLNYKGTNWLYSNDKYIIYIFVYIFIMSIEKYGLMKTEQGIEQEESFI